MRNEDDKTGQILIFAAKAVAHPGAHAGAAGLLEAALDESDCRVMIDGIGMDRIDVGDIVDNLALVREELTQPSAALTVLVELENRRRNRKRILPGGHTRYALALSD